MPDIKEIDTELMVIGAGMAGMAAALFAGQHRIDAVQVGITGEINFASGLLDLLGVHPVAKGFLLADPWDGIKALVRDIPNHPYARLTTDEINSAMVQCLDFLEKAGLPYCTNGRRNSKIITPVGTIKTTYAVPRSMFAGIQALADRTPALLVDFSGLKGFSARQIMETLGPIWPTLKRVRIPFPKAEGELYAEHAARTLDAHVNRRLLADSIRPYIRMAGAVGLPAVLGIYHTQEIMAELEDDLGIPIFEIPTMMPAITGLRLRETFEQQLPKMGIRTFYQQRVLEVQVLANGEFQFLVGHQVPEMRVRARKTILASGRFFGKGLHADRLGIRESLFNLPIEHPVERTLWHRKDLLHAQGHPINRAGIKVDSDFRPVNADNKVIHDNLYAAGSILAHQDWMRQKCGSGLSIATAFGAVRTVASQNTKSSGT